MLVTSGRCFPFHLHTRSRENKDIKFYYELETLQFVVIVCLASRSSVLRAVRGLSHRLRSLPHLMSISSVPASNHTPPPGCGRQLNGNAAHKFFLSLSFFFNTYREWQSPSHPLLLKLKRACKHLIVLQSKSIVLFPGPQSVAAGRFGPQILTDALDGSDPSPSAQARRTGSNKEKTEICVYHCQNAYTAWHLHDSKLCRFIKHLKKLGYFSKLLRKERKLHWEREKESTQLEQFISDCVLWQVIRDTVWCRS